MAIPVVAQEVCVRSFPNWIPSVLLLASALAACAPAGPAAAPAGSPPAPAVFPPAAGPAPSEVRWLAVELGGAPVGRTREAVDRVAGGGFATRVASEVRIGRLGKVVEMATDFTLTEDAQGELQAVR